jgi:hypothetical protein
VAAWQIEIHEFAAINGDAASTPRLTRLLHPKLIQNGQIIRR